MIFHIKPKSLRLCQYLLWKGCFLVGGKANFTDSYETLKGFMEGLLSLEEKPNYPILVRRDGPNREKAFAYLTDMATKHDLDLHLYDATTPIIEAAKIMVQLIKETESS